MEEATEVCWYCKGEPRFSATSFCGVCYGTGYAPRSTRMRAEFNDGPLVVSGPCPSCESLRAELATLKAKVRELDAWLSQQDEAWDRVVRCGPPPNDVHHNAKGHRNQTRMTVQRLRELGLISVDTPQTKE